MKILYLTTIGSTMNFFTSFIRSLLDEGHTVDIATNETQRKVPQCYYDWNCNIHHISYARSPWSSGNVQAIKQIKKLVTENNYDIVHCHTPVAAACTRLACRSLRKNGTKVFYTAHGFHFYKGAPLKNWLFFYPIEKLCAYFTDVLITINREDYERAKKRLKAKFVEYVPGVGIDVDKFRSTVIDRAAKKMELGVPENSTVLVSVGELNKNKNHEVIIRALAELNDANVHYMIAGEGPLKGYLRELADSLGVADRVHLLGYRNDVAEIYKAADICCFPSFREGLGLAAIEAMACGLPIVTSNVHGINDYSVDGVTGYKCVPRDVHAFGVAFKKLICDEPLSNMMGMHNEQLVEKYDLAIIASKMRQIYSAEVCREENMMI